MSNPFISVINSVLPEPQASLLDGILFGVRAQLPAELYQALITTGTIHIVALSGQNISILTRIISETTLFLGRKVSIIVSCLTIILFVFFVGLEPTIVRAAVMGIIGLTAVYLGKQAWAFYSLILTGGIMLLISPGLLTNISFELSFLATFGIIVFGGSHQPQSRGLLQEIFREIKVSFRTTLAAQVFTLPVIFFQFRRISLIAPLTNVLIGWLISPTMSLGLLLSLFGWLLPFTKTVLGAVVWVPLSFIIYAVNLTAKIPYAAVNF